MSNDRNARFFNYPNAKAHEHAYRAPPAPKNTVTAIDAGHADRFRFDQET
jgi:hypothetical protein